MSSKNTEFGTGNPHFGLFEESWAKTENLSTQFPLSEICSCLSEDCNFLPTLTF